MKNIELNDKELDIVTGGKLTEEAEAWVERNKEEVIKRGGSLGMLANLALNYVKNCETVYDVDGLKAALKEYDVNADDLT